jgi:tetratricopeptide (TPR) repeat protein
VNDLEIIAHCRKELRADPGSLRFVQLADALRRVGRVREAEEVLADGLLLHGRLGSARLVLARVYADTDRQADALAILDELYPRDAENVALVSLYLELLVWASRPEEAAELLNRAELVGVPEDVRVRAREFLEADLWATRAEAAAEVSALPAGDLRKELGDPVTLPDTSVMTFVDPFATPVVARRLERAGRREAALRIWEEVALVRPEDATSQAHLDALRAPVAATAGDVRLDQSSSQCAATPPGAGAGAVLRQFLRAVDPESA